MGQKFNYAGSSDSGTFRPQGPIKLILELSAHLRRGVGSKTKPAGHLSKVLGNTMCHFDNKNEQIQIYSKIPLWWNTAHQGCH